MPIKMIKVKSSNLDEIGYDEQSAKLYVRFKQCDRLYCYDPCPRIIFLGLQFSQSKGSFLSTQVIPFFRCTRVSEAELSQTTHVGIH